MFSGSRLKLASNYKPLSSFNKNKAWRFLLSLSFHEQITSVTTIADEGIRDRLIEFPANITIPWSQPKLYEQYGISIYQHVVAHSLLYDNHLNECSVCIFGGKQQEMVTRLWQCRVGWSQRRCAHSLMAESKLKTCLADERAR